MNKNKSIEFFESQFQRQVEERDFELNSFELWALEYLRGSILDLGCGLGNLSLEAGRRGHKVHAVDVSQTAIDRINDEASRHNLDVRAEQRNIANYVIDQDYDSIVAIGLLMFFPCERAIELLSNIQKCLNPGGIAVINVLTEGTTFMGMFNQNDYCLFEPNELTTRFSGWKIMKFSQDSYLAPESTTKDFDTIIAEKPESIVDSKSTMCQIA